MRITINISELENKAPGADLFSLDLPSDATVGLLKELVEAETGVAATSQHIYHHGQLLSDESKTMEKLEVSYGDVLTVHIRDLGRSTFETSTPPSARRQAAPSQMPQTHVEQDPEAIRLRLLENPQALQEVLRSRPEIEPVINDPVRFAEVYRQMADQAHRVQMMRSREIAALNADPFDVTAQRRIEEMIREERVQENLQNAIEHNPEVFGKVHMLYIDVEVNGHKVKAFVDSGAQATIMSPSCAEACGIMRLVDKRFAGIARGVGTANILGKVHSAQIKIGSLFLVCSFTVMEGKDVDLLLGLDMLRRHQACIDLQKDKLVIQGVEVPFLGEADIPRNADEPTVGIPGGTSIGARTGARTGAVAAPVAQQVQQVNSPGQTNSPSTQRAQASFPPEDIERLVDLGFPRDRVIAALRACGGNVDVAAALLLQP